MKHLLFLFVIALTLSRIICRNEDGIKNIFMATMVSFREKVDDTYNDYETELDK
jgi:hypothetical protein